MPAAQVLASRAILAALPLLFAPGCASSRVTDPPRTATEQFLLSTAVAKSVAKLDLKPMAGMKVFLDATYFSSPEQPFVLGELRARLFQNGVILVRDMNEAEAIMEVRSYGVGIDRDDYLLGIPSLQFSGNQSGNFPLLSPELGALKNRDQRGIAAVAFVVYRHKTGELIAVGEPEVGGSTRVDWWYFGVGPKSRGDIAPVDVSREKNPLPVE